MCYVLFWLIIKCLLKTYYVPDPVLDFGGTVLTKMEKVPAFIVYSGL